MQKKRVVAAIVLAMMVFSSFAASAEWIFAGYDTQDIYNPVKVYNEKLDGYYTSKFKTEPVTPVWIAEGFERAFPHAGYDRMYLEGNAQPYVTRYNNTFAQWETRFVDCYWEIAGDCNIFGIANNHKIYQRQQTNIPGIGWEWDYSDDAAFDAAHLCVPTNRYATVEHNKLPYGVSEWDLNGNPISDEVKAMYDAFGVKYKFDAAWFDSVNLSAINENTGKHLITDAEIAKHVPVILSEHLTGPAFPAGKVTKNAAREYLANPTWTGWCPETVVAVCDEKYISWTEPTYEMADPYRYYEVLVVNGVVFDGRELPNGTKLPYIWRYTGGKATPKVTWEYAFVEYSDPTAVMDLNNSYPNGAIVPVEDLPFKIVEIKKVDGKVAYNNDGTPVYRYNEKYGNVYAKVTDKTVEFWLKDYVSDVKIFAYDKTSKTGYYNGYVLSGVVVY